MKKTMLTLFFAVAVFLVQSCNKISGSGPVVSKTYNYSGFNAIDIGIDGDVYFKQDSVYKVEIQAQQNILDIIHTNLSGTELQLSFEKYQNVGTHDRITVYISGPFLTKAGINGSGNLHVLEPLSGNAINLKVNGSGSISFARISCQTLNADISGSGSISINGGAVTYENLQISGSGSIDAQSMSADEAASNTSGSGVTKLSVKNKLTVRISGSGDVYYTGNPTVQSSISGSGKLHHN